MLRQLLEIPYVKDLVKRLKRNPTLRNACGYREKAPTEAHSSQMKKRIGADGFRVIEAWMRMEELKLRGSQPLSAVGLVQVACVDDTDLRAWSSRILGDNKLGRGDTDARLARAEKWKLDAESCYEYWSHVGADCAICMAVCSFGKPDTTLHRMVKWLIARSPFARRVFPYFDDLIYGAIWKPREPLHWLGRRH